MKRRFEHTQVGVLLVTFLAVGIFCSSFLMIYFGFSCVGLISLVVLDCGIVLLSTLTVTVDEKSLAVSLGPGLLHKRIDLDDVRDCVVTSTPACDDVYVRSMPDGWLYNISRIHAVDLIMRNGRLYRIGTDVPHDLAEAVRRVLLTRRLGFTPT